MVIGLTGGVGAGKSEVMRYLEKRGAQILMLDDIADELMLPGTKLSEKLQQILPPHIFKQDGTIDRKAMAEVFFSDDELRSAVNAEVYRYVRAYVENTIRGADEQIVIIESAVLRSSGFTDLCDEIWFVNCSEKIRRERLKKTRGYSDLRIDRVIRAQKKDTDLMKEADFILNNEHDFDDTIRQIEERLAQ